MKLNYYRVNKPLTDELKPCKSFMEDMRMIDRNLHVVFNRLSRRWEIYRYSQGTYHWILEVCNDDKSYRPLDNRTIKKLYEIDIICRYGSIANFERHFDEQQKKWQSDRQKEMDYELKCDLKDDRYLWQRAAENVRSGIINDPPIQKDRKAISYQKGVL